MSPRKMREEDDFEDVDLNETEIPILPDDIIFMIFKELTTEERAPLGTSCQRFREVDFELGRKFFDMISGKSNDVAHSLKLVTKSTSYSLQGRHSSLIPETIHNLRLFRKSSTKLMKIKISSVGCPEEFRSIFCEKFKTIPYTILRGSIVCDYTSLECFYQNLIQDRNLEHASVYLKLFSSFPDHNPLAPSEIDITRAFLMQLPKVNAFKLAWSRKKSETVKSQNLETVIDDPILIHLVSNSNHASLERIHCTGNGLLSVFELVCRSSEYKYISCTAPKSVADELFAMPNLRFRLARSGQKRYMLDHARQSMLWVESQGDLSKFWMGKAEEAKKKVVHRAVSWQ